MRRIIIAATTVTAMALLPGLAGATHSPGQGPKFDKTNGTGENAQAGEVHVNAKSVGGTTTAQGHFYVHDPPPSLFGGAEIAGDVTCHRAGPPFGGPNSSTTGGVVTRSSDPAVVGQGMLIFIEDDGGGSAASPDDLFVVGLGTPPDPSLCDFFAPGQGFENDIVRGNYVVHDGA